MAVITPRIIFWGRWLCPCASSQCSQWQWQSRTTKNHDNANINAENTNSHGSTQCGINSAWANSGANSPTIDNTIGNTQQNRCGKMLAIIPIFTALFFIHKTPTGVPNRNTSSPGKIALRATGVRPSAFLRRFEPLPQVQFLLASPTGIEPVSRV